VYTVRKLEDFSPSALDSAAAELLDAFNREREDVVTTAEDPDLGIVKKTQAFKDFRDRWMARKSGLLPQVVDTWLGSAPNAHKREAGQAVNRIRALLTASVEELHKHVNFCSLADRDTLIRMRADKSAVDVTATLQQHKFQQERLDITLPGIRRPLGAEHPVIKTMQEIVQVFKNLGYSIGEGPEIESDYYNFESLNFPPNHPARDTQDTVFVAGQEQKAQRDRLLLRTHTSPVQVRYMEKNPPPIRVVIPGKVHRSDTPDATHFPIFHQVEGLAVDTNITFSDLKGTLDHAMKALFGSAMKTRFFPSFFPFTEPSADVAVTCFVCGGKGCRVCKMSGWIELLGCGMVDPNVFEFVKSNGYDPKKISGFAFGMGVERIAMAKYGIGDIQLLFSGDVRFLEQFA